MQAPRTIFRQYDVRGLVGAELTPELARALGRAFATVAWARLGHAPVVAVGRDNRPSGPGLAAGVRQGIVDAGGRALDVGEVPTPALYFATHHLGTDAGLQVTGSHNPPEFNGFKMVLVRRHDASDCQQHPPEANAMKILIASQVFPEAVERLRERHDVICAFGADSEKLKALISDREALVFRSGVTIDAALMSRGPGLRYLIRAGSGLDNLDMDYVRAHGIELVRIPGPGARAVAEPAFGLMLSVARQVRTADALLRQGRWAKSEIQGYLLAGKTLGVYGMGSIGSLIGRLGVASAVVVFLASDAAAYITGQVIHVNGGMWSS